jgi:hypothetical protein
MLWIWFIVGILILAVLVVVLLRLGGQPIAYRGLLLTDMDRFLKSFLQQSGAGSNFILERESGPEFLQLAVTGRRGDRLEVEFGLPDAAWSQKRFDLVHAAVGSAGYSYHVETNSGNMDIPRFLRVQIRGNRHELTLVLLHVLELAASQLEFEAKDRYTLRMSGPISSEYQQELATQLEQLPRSGRVGHALAAWLRRSAGTRQRL